MPDLCRVLKLEAARLSPGFKPNAEAAHSVAARALMAAGGARRPVEPAFRFAIRGRTGNRYEIVFEEGSAGPYLRCDCTAGRHRRRCRHVDAVVEGDVTDLISNNHADVERLRVRIAATGVAIGPHRKSVFPVA